MYVLFINNNKINIVSNSFTMFYKLSNLLIQQCLSSVGIWCSKKKNFCKVNLYIVKKKYFEMTEISRCNVLFKVRQKAISLFKEHIFGPNPLLKIRPNISYFYLFIFFYKFEKGFLGCEFFSTHLIIYPTLICLIYI